MKCVTIEVEADLGGMGDAIGTIMVSSSNKNDYVSSAYTDNSMMMPRGTGRGGWVEVGKGGENGGICININNKNKV